MIRLLRFLWTGSWHEHKWVHMVKTHLLDPDHLDGPPTRIDYVRECEHCGVVKTFKG